MGFYHNVAAKLYFIAPSAVDIQFDNEFLTLMFAIILRYISPIIQIGYEDIYTHEYQSSTETGLLSYRFSVLPVAYH